LPVHGFYELEIIILVQYIKVFQCILISYFAIGEAYELVENTERIPHTAFTFLGDNLQRGLICPDVFLIAYFPQVIHGIIDGYALEIKDLAAA
jgi:hypothetical protein